MTERAAFLVDHVLPRASVRQWTLSLPMRLRYLLAYDAKLCSQVLGAFAREVFHWYRFKAKAELSLESVAPVRCGSVTAIQRFDSGLRLNVHYHLAALDGVYVDGQRNAAGAPVFFAMPPPTDEDVADVVLRTRRRVLALLGNNGIDLDYGEPDDRLADSEPMLAMMSKAAIANIAAAGPRAGKPTERLRDALALGASGLAVCAPRCVNIDGFNLHANVRVKAAARKELEKLIRYVARPAISNDRLTELPDGKVAYKLKRTWSDGSRAMVFTPLELIARLLPLVPAPRVNQLLYHGVLAPAAEMRREVVATACGGEVPKNKDRTKNYCWAELMQRAFAFDLLLCPVCGGQRKVIATIMDRDTIRAILVARGLPTEAPEPAAAQRDPQQELWVDP